MATNNQPAPGTPPRAKALWGLMDRRPRWWPTWRGWLVLLLGCVALAVLAAKGVYPFLTVNDPAPDGLLVVEGWSPDYALKAALTTFRQGRYDKLYLTGGPLEQGGLLSGYRSHAELAAATLTRMGLATNSLQAVPAPLIRKDRTYLSAVVLRNWLLEHKVSVSNLTVVTVGPHARRTRLMFQHAFGPEVRIGIIGLKDLDYDPERWWASSSGFRNVTDEAIAYGYARLLFRVPKELDSVRSER